MEELSKPVYYSVSESERFFRNRYTASVAFIIGILLFLLPFAEIRCNNMTMAKNTGLGIAIGSPWKSSALSGLQNGFESLSKDGPMKPREQLSEGMNIFAIAALVAAIAGLFFSLTSSRHRALIGLCTGILSAMLLIALMIHLRMSFKSQLSSPKNWGEDDTGFDRMSLFLKLHFTVWYYMSLISFMTAAFFAYKHYRIEMEDAIRTAHQFDFQKEAARQPDQ
ncbi:MAG: hypothetical protein ABL876_06105 [Chitinophagaceae bacterium]